MRIVVTNEDLDSYTSVVSWLHYVYNNFKSRYFQLHQRPNISLASQSAWPI